MRNNCVVLCLLFIASNVALAQGKANVQWKCDKPSDQHSLPVGDKSGHAFGIEHLNCTAIKGEIEDARSSRARARSFLISKAMR